MSQKSTIAILPKADQLSEEFSEESLEWQGSEVLKQLQDPPVIYRTINGYVAVAVISPHEAIAHVAEDVMGALWYLAVDVARCYHRVLPVAPNPFPHVPEKREANEA